MVNLQSVGCHFTWTNGEVSSKLDRALVNHQWLTENFHSFVKFRPPRCLSDHSCYFIVSRGLPGAMAVQNFQHVDNS